MYCFASESLRRKFIGVVDVPVGTSHVESATTGCDDDIAARAGAVCAAEVSSLLQNLFSSRSQSSRQWSAAETLVTRQRVGSKSVRVRIGENFIERIPAHLLPLFRLDFLPPPSAVSSQ